MDPQAEQQISDQTADLLSLSEVKRWTVVHTLRPQSVAEHSFAVAIIASELAARLGMPRCPVGSESSGKPVDFWGRGDLLWWALIHDAPESLTGDIDGKFKRDNPEMKAHIMAAEERSMPWYRESSPGVYSGLRWLVKVADFIETATFIKKWGIGPRADDIYQELWHQIAGSQVASRGGAVDSLCRVAALDYDEVILVVRDIMHHSVSEDNTAQLRRHRRP